MNKNPKQKPDSGIQIDASRTPKKKIVQADPFARIQLHPLEELESRDSARQIESEEIIGVKDLVDPTLPYTTLHDTTPHDTITNDSIQEGDISRSDAGLESASNVETSPHKNFTKVPNSIAKKAIPEKLFKGLSKHTYDILYQLTRGAVKPVRSIQLSKKELVKLSGLAANTLQTHFGYLREAGLIKVQLVSGKHDGSIYEVFVPEELDDPTQVYPTQPNPTQQEYTRNSVPDTTRKSYILGWGNPLENKELNPSPKTSFKDSKTDDDDNAGARAGFSLLNERLAAAAKKLTGKEVSNRDAEDWGTLADLLILELEVAASRTNGISSVPALLTEILRRQFFASRRQIPAGKTSKKKSDTVGKSDFIADEIKPLDLKNREAAVEQLREFAGDPLLRDFQKWYDPEDWKWITERLKNID